MNGCEVGLLCVDAALAEECAPGSGCSLPCCDLNDPIVCPGQGPVCVPLFKEGEAPPGHENVGICGLPP